MSKELNVDLGVTGLTVTASVYLLSVLKASGIACVEVGVTGKYSGDFTASPNVAGVYQVAFFVGGATVLSGGGQIVWDGSAEVLQTGDSFARIGAAGAGLTALGDTRIANLDAAVSTRSTYAGGAVASVTGAVGSVTGLTASDVGAIKTTIGVAGAGLTALGDVRLANLDATVSSRTKPADTQARVTLVDTVTTLTNAPAVPSAAAVADAVWDELISGHAVAGSTGAALSTAAAHSTGSGAIAWPYTVTSSVTGLPIADVDVWVTSDLAGANVLASGRTNASGVVTFYLDAAASIFVWRQKSGWNFDNPDQDSVS